MIVSSDDLSLFTDHGAGRPWGENQCDGSCSIHPCLPRVRLMAGSSGLKETRLLYYYQVIKIPVVRIVVSGLLVRSSGLITSTREAPSASL